MHWKSILKGTYLSALEFDGRTPTLTIRDIQAVDLENDKKEVKPSLVIFFSECDRGMVTCKTNVLALDAMFGGRVEGWKGKRITLYEDKSVTLGSGVTSGIRIKGSPDLAESKTITIKLPRKKPFQMQLEKIAAKATQDSPPDPQEPNQ